MSGVDNCPSCKASLIGEPVPERYRAHQEGCAEQVARLSRCFCLPYGDATHYRREIGQEIPGEYDGILFWLCPDCGHAWQRWPKDSPLHEKADYFIAANNEQVGAA